MAETTVKQLAEAVGTPVDRLLQQMKDAGLPQAAETDVVAEAQKESLLHTSSEVMVKRQMVLKKSRSNAVP